MENNLYRRGLALLLAVCTLLSCAACGGGTKAATMRLRKTEGTVGVSDGGGKEVELRENLGLYSGYGVDTRSESYAWINLDEVKLTKLDQDSQVKIKKEDKHLEIEVLSGSLFFNVAEPLADDESLNIRTSAMAVGIRGTCGWVEVPDSGTMKVFLLEGRVECAAGENTAAVNAGEMAVMTAGTAAGNGIAVSKFSAADIPAFVLEEVQQDDSLAAAILNASGLDVSGLDPDNLPPAGLDRSVYDHTLTAMAELCLRLSQNSTDPQGLAYEVAHEYGKINPDILSLMASIHRSYGGSPAGTLGAYSYAYYDVDHNGIEELLIGYQGKTVSIICYEESSETTIKVAFGNHEPLNEFAICSDGTTVTRVTFRDGTCNVAQERIVTDGFGMTRVEGVTFEFGAQPELYDELMAQAGGEVTDIEWHPLSDFAAGLDIPAPEEPAEPPANDTASLLAPYAGTYTMYSEYESYRSGYGGTTVTLNADGTVTGGAVDGRTPSDIRQESNGSIVIMYSNTMWFTLYPANGPTPSARWYDGSQVNLEFMDAGGGLAVLVYHADPASLG